MKDKKYLMGDIRDSVDYLSLVEKKGLKDLPPLIITCAITGGLHGAELNPNLPEDLEAQVESAKAAYEAGASMIHIHRRKPDDLKSMSYNHEEFREINRRIREACPDLIINNTCLGGRYINIENQTVSDILHGSIKAEPEVASVDMSCFSSHLPLKARTGDLTGRDNDEILKFNFFMDYDDARTTLKEFKAHGIKPELELFDIGDIKYINQFIKEGLLEGPHWIQMLFGGNGTMPTPQSLINAASLLPKDSIFSVIGIGGYQTAILTIAIIMGYHVRVGLEDNVFYAPGQLAESNAQLVERIVRIAKELGRPIATPQQAREMMGLDPNPRQY